MDLEARALSGEEHWELPLSYVNVRPVRPEKLVGEDEEPALIGREFPLQGKLCFFEEHFL